MTNHNRPDVIYDKTSGREHDKGYGEALKSQEHTREESKDRKPARDRMEGKKGQPNFIPGEAPVGEKKPNG